MNEKRKISDIENEMDVYIEKPFNWRKLFKILGIVIGAVVAVFLVVFGVHFVEGRIRGGEITKYENLRSATVKKTAEYCDINLDEVDKVRIDFWNPREYEIGYLTDNPDYSHVFYMLYDKAEIEKLISKLKDIKMYGVREDEYKYYVESDLDWQIKLCVGDKEYAFVLTGGYIEGQDKVEELKVGVEHKDYPKLSEDYPDPLERLWSERTLIYNQSLNEYIYELYERCVKDITVEDILSVYDEGNTELFFTYENNGGKGRTHEEKLEDGLHVLRYTLRIADFDGYIEIDKQNEGIDDKVYTDILYIKIYNNEGEYIDYLNSTKAEVEAFLK